MPIIAAARYAPLLPPLPPDILLMPPAPCCCQLLMPPPMHYAITLMLTPLRHAERYAVVDIDIAMFADVYAGATPLLYFERAATRAMLLL